MSAYGDLTRAGRVLFGGDAGQTQEALAELTTINAEVSAQIDMQLGRTASYGATITALLLPAPAGSFLPVPDLVLAGLVVSAYGTLLVRNTDYQVVWGADGTALVGLRRVSAGLPRAWAEATSAPDDAISLTGTVCNPPAPLVAAATNWVVREWQARTTRYTGVGGGPNNTLQAPADDPEGMGVRSKLAGWAGRRIPIIRGGP
jgi:hypothetical protein